MSRSWERKVRKNMSQVNKVRKKSGQGNLVLNKPSTAQGFKRFTGRNIILPLVLLIFIGFYNFIMLADPNFKFDGMYWVTVISYILLAALFFFRKPYLNIGKDYIQTRRLMGDKQLFAVAIKQIKVLNGYVIIIPNNGSSWTFSKMFNRFPIHEMAEELKQFAEKNNIPFVQE